MKLFLQIAILFIFLGLSGCNVYPQGRPQDTSSARAAYGDAAPDFRANKKKNQKRKKKAVKAAKRKKTGNDRLYFHGRPY